jgi:hypothetical protein
MMIFVVTPVAIMEDMGITEEQEVRYKCGGLDT